jgi:8-oxo-dGTP diphosphatase
MKAQLKWLVGHLRLYWLASVTYETWRLVVRPHTHGALVAIWYKDQVLLVETSYRQNWGLPGGGIAGGETVRQAAVRELAEELGLVVQPEELLNPWTISERGLGGLNTVTIYELEARELPKLVIDGLEIVACHWFRLNEALDLKLSAHVHVYLQLRNQRCKLPSD